MVNGQWVMGNGQSSILNDKSLLATINELKS